MFIGIMEGDNIPFPDEEAKTPTINFQRIVYLDYNCNQHDIVYVMGEISYQYDCHFFFKLRDGNNTAIGPGANRQVYQKLCQELTNNKIDGNETILTMTNSYFVDVNDKCKFWDSHENVKLFVVLIGMIIKAECLQYHFSPALLEAITYKTMDINDLEFYMDKIDPDMLNYAKKVSAEDFEDLGVDFDDHIGLYRGKIIGDQSLEKIIIYGMIAENFQFFDSFSNYKIRDVDNFFSGPYKITPELVMPIMKISEEKYIKPWNRFISSLNEHELKQLLLTFGNSLSLQHNYSIHITDLVADVHISTCSRTIAIRQDLFDNDEQLSILKSYLINKEEYISDYTHSHTVVNDDLDGLRLNDSDDDSDEVPNLYDPNRFDDYEPYRSQNTNRTEGSQSGIIYWPRFTFETIPSIEIDRTMFNTFLRLIERPISRIIPLVTIRSIAHDDLIHRQAIDAIDANLQKLNKRVIKKIEPRQNPTKKNLPKLTKKNNRNALNRLNKNIPITRGKRCKQRYR